VIWTHLDRAELRNEAGLVEFLQPSEHATALARRAISGDDVFDSKFVDAASDIERLVQERQKWTGSLDVLESLTWLLYRIMLGYSAVPARLRTGNVEFITRIVPLVKKCMHLARALRRWDSADAETLRR
jgi:hypothetical protein